MWRHFIKLKYWDMTHSFLAFDPRFSQTLFVPYARAVIKPSSHEYFISWWSLVPVFFSRKFPSPSLLLPPLNSTLCTYARENGRQPTSFSCEYVREWQQVCVHLLAHFGFVPENFRPVFAAKAMALNSPRRGSISCPEQRGDLLLHAKNNNKTGTPCLPPCGL